MTAIRIPDDDPGFGLRTEQGVTPQYQPPGDIADPAIWGAAFRQSTSVVSAIHYMPNSASFAPEPDYNPIKDIKSWDDPKYLLDHGQSFVGVQSKAEALSVKNEIDTNEADKRLLAANGKVGFVATTVAGMADPTMLLPGGVAIDAAK